MLIYIYIHAHAYTHIYLLIISCSFSPLLLPCFNQKSHGFRSFSYAAPHLWNHLPNNVCTALNYMSFTKNLKSCSFNKAFPT